MSFVIVFRAIVDYIFVHIFRQFYQLKFCVNFVNVNNSIL